MNLVSDYALRISLLEPGLMYCFRIKNVWWGHYLVNKWRPKNSFR